MFKKIVVGISGGVDSAIAALLLKQRGFNVHGVFMKNWDITDETGNCSLENDWIDAQWICDKLKIPVQRVDFVKEFWNDVFGNFISEYEDGLTPNPDIRCNKFVKFNAFFEYAKTTLAADAIATGHYARSSFGAFLENYEDNKNARLLRAIDDIKDQTFFLSQIPQQALRRTMFPLGNLLKKDVKRLAMESGLEKIANKKESYGICFIGKRNFKEFISEYIGNNSGDFIDIESGKILGQHDGIHNYTLGQNIKLLGCKEKMFVYRKMSDKRTLLVAPGRRHSSFYSDLVFTDNPYWINSSPFSTDTGRTLHVVTSKFCFQHIDPLVPCTIYCSKNGLIIKLNESLRALTPGQYATFYKNDECLGSARIITPGPSNIYKVEIKNHAKFGLTNCDSDSDSNNVIMERGKKL